MEYYVVGLGDAGILRGFAKGCVLKEAVGPLYIA